MEFLVSKNLGRPAVAASRQMGKRALGNNYVDFFRKCRWAVWPFEVSKNSEM